ALLRLPGQSPVGRDEDQAPERAAGGTMRGERALGVLAAQVLHRREAQVVLGLRAQPPLQPRGGGHAEAPAGAGAGAAARSSLRPVWAAIAIGSNSAPIGGE